MGLLDRWRAVAGAASTSMLSLQAPATRPLEPLPVLGWRLGSVLARPPHVRVAHQSSAWTSEAGEGDVEVLGVIHHQARGAVDLLLGQLRAAPSGTRGSLVLRFDLERDGAALHGVVAHAALVLYHDDPAAGMGAREGRRVACRGAARAALAGLLRHFGAGFGRRGPA